MPSAPDRAEQDFFDDVFPCVSGEVQKKILTVLRRSPTISLVDLQKKIGKKRLHSALHALEHHGLIKLEDVVASGKVKAKTLQHAVLLASEILPSVWMIWKNMRQSDGSSERPQDRFRKICRCDLQRCQIRIRAIG
jgi:hypothetical protein